MTLVISGIIKVEVGVADNTYQTLIVLGITKTSLNNVLLEIRVSQNFAKVGGGRPVKCQGWDGEREIE